MNAFRHFDRRSVLSAIASGAASLALPPAFAADNTILQRAIPRGRGEKLPVIGIGTSRSFEVGNDAVKRTQLTQVLQTLVNGGGSLIDTASAYGTAEEVIGAIATGTPMRPKLFIMTKLEARSGEEAQKEFATSLKRLQVDKVDLLQMHNVKSDSDNLAFFREMQAAGKARYVGATTTHVEGYGAIERLIRKDKPDFIEINCSIADRGAEERIIPAAADVGAAVLIALPYGRSSLFKKVNGKPLPPLAKDIGATTWGQVFLKYLLGNPVINAVIPGTDNVAHVQDNLAAGRGPMPDAKQRAELVRYFEGLG